MEENKRITKEDYVIAKLSNRISALEKQLAEAEFTVLLLKQEIGDKDAETEEACSLRSNAVSDITD